MVNVLRRLGQSCPAKLSPAWDTVAIVPRLRNTALRLYSWYAVEPDMQLSQIQTCTVWIHAFYGPPHVKGTTELIPTSLGSSQALQLNSEWLFCRLCHCRSLHQSSGTALSLWKEPLKPQWLADQHPVPVVPLPTPSAGGERSFSSLEKIKAQENAHPQPLIQFYWLKNHLDRELGVNFRRFWYDILGFITTWSISIACC